MNKFKNSTGGMQARPALRPWLLRAPQGRFFKKYDQKSALRAFKKSSGKPILNNVCMIFFRYPWKVNKDLCNSKGNFITCPIIIFENREICFEKLKQAFCGFGFLSINPPRENFGEANASFSKIRPSCRRGRFLFEKTIGSRERFRAYAGGRALPLPLRCS